MGTEAPVRVFIGSGEASLLERKVLMHSLRKNSRRELDIWVMNGTHNALERNDEPPVPAGLPLHLKYRSFTEFSLFRYMIPDWCNHQGRAIYLDSDMIALGDIGELFDAPMGDAAVLAKPAYKADEWGTSVMLIDCARARWDLEQTYREIDAGHYDYYEFSRFDPKYLRRHPLQIGEIDPQWNVFDHHDAQTKLIHYTELLTQPWKFPGHPHGELWFDYFREAQSLGLISDWDVQKSIMRAYVRQDILQGNRPGSPAVKLKSIAWQIKQRVARGLRRAG